MIKKMFSAVLAVVMLSALLPAFADYAPMVYTSNFEGGAAVTVGTTAYSYSDDVWDISTSNARRVTAYNAQLDLDRIDLAVAPEALGSENHVLKATQWKSTALTTKAVALNDTTDAVYISFRFKVPTGTGTGQWQLGAGGHYTDTQSGNHDTSLLTIRDNNTIGIVNQAQNPQIAALISETVSYQRDTWYTAVVYVDKNTRAAYIYDGSKLIAQNSTYSDTKEMVVARADLRSWCNTYFLPNGFTIMLDDANITAVKKASDTVTLTASSITDGETDVSLVPTFDLTFSRPMATDQAGKVTVNGSGEGVLVSAVSPYTLRVSLTKQLDYSTDYTLDFSRVCDMTGNTVSGVNTLDFTTVYMPLSLYPTSVSLKKEGSTTFGLPLELPAKNHTGTPLSARLFVAFYQKTASGDTLVGVENKAVTIPADAESVSFTVSGNYHDVSSVKVMAFDSLDTVQPLSEPVIVPVEEDVPVYNVDRFEKNLIFKQDFEGNPLPSNVTTQYHYSASQIDPTGGINGGGAYHVSGDAEAVADGYGTLSYVISDLNIPAGNSILMTAKLKASGISGSVAESGSNAYAEGLRTTMTFKNTETGESKSIYMIDETVNGTTDWIESMQYAICDFPVDSVSVTCFLAATIHSGEGWYDDVCLYMVGFDPFAGAVLESPVYKGFIYGEGGVNDIRLSTNVLDYNIYDLENSAVTARIVDEQDKIMSSSVITDIQPEMRFSFSSDRLTMGQDYYLQLSLDNTETDTCYGRREWKLRKRPADYRPNNFFDEYGRYVIDGKPTFLMGVYGENKLYELIDKIDGSAINLIVPYGYIWIPVGRNSAGEITTSVDTALLDYAQERGVKMTAPLGNYLYSRVASTGNFSRVIKSPADSRAVFESFAKTLDHPAILGYYMADELSSQRYGAEVEWASRILSDLDSDGITFNVTSREMDQREQLRFADTVNTSSYPVNVGDGTDDLSKVTEHISAITQYLPEGNRPQFAVLQSYKKGGALRGPDGAEMRNMAYQAICAGMQGIIWYNGFQMEETGWEDLLAVCDEVEGFYPMLLSTDEAPDYEVIAGDWFESIAKSYNGKGYLFTVNKTRSEQRATVHIGSGATVCGLCSGRTYVPDADGNITVDYAAIGVEVLEIVK
ncbi:MAG: Ig-like domain-containing protein [Clostridia bacterium]|nr:Ig-like domain-containing protein [Clostridia bacterium]